jgi:hypothetical protein
MTTEPIPRCGKIIYPNQTMVHQFMLKQRSSCESCGKKGVKLNYYYCEPCEGYHLTRMTQQEQQKFIKRGKRAYGNRKKELREWMEKNPYLPFAVKIQEEEMKNQFKDKIKEIRGEINEFTKHE